MNNAKISEILYYEARRHEALAQVSEGAIRQDHIETAQALREAAGIIEKIK
ncbi:MAG: hypothetical protein FWG88_07020 [Oscillospiraceae bacterium]|nr:hypothetical protein [Oscillospiraceae bacterium]